MRITAKQMKRIKAHKLSVIILLIWLTCVMVSSCGERSDPASAVHAFFEAVKAQDADQALRCFAPELRGPYRAALQMSAELFHTDMKTMLSGLVGIPCLTANMGFQIRNIIQTDETHANVYVQIQTDGTEPIEVLFPCVRIGSCWFIGEQPADPAYKE